MPALDQRAAQLDVVFDYPVMDYRDRTRLVRMCVFFGRAAMRRPSRMADSDISGERRFFQVPPQIVEFPYRPADLELAVYRERRDSRRIVTAILESLETTEQDRRGFAGADVSDYSAHIFFRLCVLTNGYAPAPKREYFSRR